MSKQTLQELYDETVEYKLPIAEAVGAHVDTSVKPDVLPAVKEAYLDVNSTLYDTENLPIDPDDKVTKLFGQRYLLPPRYVAAVDVFYPEMTYLAVLGNEGIDFVALPIGHASAFYHGETKSLAIDTIAIPGTPKNEWARNLYKSALDMVNKLSRINPRLYASLGHLKSFYKGVLDDLSSRKRMKKTLVHEMSHHVLEEEGIAQHLTSPQNEGTTENLTEHVTGEQSSIPGTTYDHYKTEMGSAIRKVVGSVKGLIRSYREKGRSIIDSLYRQPEARALATA